VSAAAQLGRFRQKVMNITLDPCDVPRESFLPAGGAWVRCQRGGTDPKRFGFDRWIGLPIVRWNLIPNVSALDKVEALGGDHQGRMFPLEHEALTAEDLRIGPHGGMESRRQRVPVVVRRLPQGSAAARPADRARNEIRFGRRRVRDLRSLRWASRAAVVLPWRRQGDALGCSLSHTELLAGSVTGGAR
jgi:hypothetical protein